MPRDRPQPHLLTVPTGTLRERRLTRRRLLRLLGGLSLAGGTLSLLAACQRSTTASVDATPTATQGRRTPPASAPATVPQATPPSATPAPATAIPATPAGPQLFYQGGYSQDPVSHDFNADPNCGGEPALWAGLLVLSANLEPAADWAESWEVSGDGTRWLFHLRAGNTGWSDGTAVVADDFVWSWRRKLAPETAARDASLLFAIKNAVAVHEGKQPGEALGVRAVDRWTLEVEMEAPTGYFLAIAASLAAVPAYRPAVEAWGAAWTEAGHCVSNGPFLLESWDRGQQYMIRRNPGYWGAAAIDIERCLTPIVPADQGLNPYLLDAVDTLPVPGEVLPTLLADPTLRQQLAPSVDTATWMLLPQVTIPPLDDPRVRRALSRAIDRDRIVQVLYGRVTPAHSLLPDGFPGHLTDPAIVQMQTFDVDAALALLDDTPYRGGSGWPALTLTMRRADSDAEAIANDIIAQLSENLGLRLTLEVLEPPDFGRALVAHDRALIWTRWWFAYPDANNGYRDLFPPAGTPGRILAWTHAGYDRLTTEAAAMADPARRAEIYAECERLLQEEVAYIPVVYPVAWHLVKPWVLGLPAGPGGYRPLDSGLYSRMKTALHIKGRPKR